MELSTAQTTRQRRIVEGVTLIGLFVVAACGIALELVEHRALSFAAGIGAGLLVAPIVIALQQLQKRRSVSWETPPPVQFDERESAVRYRAAAVAGFMVALFLAFTVALDNWPASARLVASVGVLVALCGYTASFFWFDRSSIGS